MLKQCSRTTSASPCAVQLVSVTQSGIRWYHTQLCPKGMIVRRYSAGVAVERLTAHEFATLFGEVDDLVALFKREDTTLRFRRVLKCPISMILRDGKGKNRTHFIAFAGVSWPNIALLSKIAK